MCNWINVNDRLPELIKHKYGHFESVMVPVKFKWDVESEIEKGWRSGYLHQSEDGTYTSFRVNGVNGCYEVTHWYELPELLEDFEKPEFPLVRTDLRDFEKQAQLSIDVLVKVKNHAGFSIGRYIHSIEEWQVNNMGGDAPNVIEWWYLPNE